MSAGIPSVALALESEIASRFSRLVRSVARRHPCPLAEAEDVVQETLRRVVTALRAGRVLDPQALPAFVRKTAVHVCLGCERTDRRSHAALQRVGWRSGSTSAPTPLERLLDEERRARVDCALARMRREDRAVLTLCFFSDLQQEEIARRLGLAPGVLRVRKHRALRRLAAELDLSPAARPLPEATAVRPPAR